MRYNPSTDRAVDINDIAAQCHDAIVKPSPILHKRNALLELYTQRLRDGQHVPRSLYEDLCHVHSIRVAEAMGNFKRARALRAAFLDDPFRRAAAALPE